jgi:hypothetical protein
MRSMPTILPLSLTPVNSELSNEAGTPGKEHQQPAIVPVPRWQRCYLSGGDTLTLRSFGWEQHSWQTASSDIAKKLFPIGEHLQYGRMELATQALASMRTLKFFQELRGSF